MRAERISRWARRGGRTGAADTLQRMATGETRERNPRGEGDRLRTRLLDVATEMLAEVHDVDALSVRAVTAAAGVSPTALYLHFADKDELVRAIKTRCFAALGDRLADAQAEHEGDPAAQVEAMGHAYLAFAREQPGWYEAIFHTSFRKQPPAGDDGIDGAGQRVFAMLVEAVARCGVADGEEAYAIATVLWTSLHGRASVARAMPWFPLPEEGPWVTMIARRWVGSSGRGGAEATG